MIHRIIATVLGVTLAAVAVCAEPAPPVSVLLITLDTTRADHLGCYGSDLGATPNLDRLAGGGVLFRQALSPAPLTLPSHTSLFSARVPRRHGARDNLSFTVDEKVPLLAAAMAGSGRSTGGWVGSVVLDRSTGLDRGFDLYDDTVRVGERAAFDYRERAASQVVDAVVDDLPEIEPPFFLWVHLYDPHLPYVPPEPFRSRFKEDLYAGEIAFMDDQVGRLLKAVRGKSGPLVVAVAGDHGESLGDHGETDHGVFVYQATQHVPLILAGHGVPAGKQVNGTVGLVDLAPTLLELAGVPPLPGAGGRSLVPLLSGEGKALKSWNGSYELESMYGRNAYGWEPPRALVQGGFKYIDLPRPELYDLGKDPEESRDLLPAAQGKVARKARKLRSALAARLGEDDGGDPDPAALDPDRRADLESLGYLGGSGKKTDGPLIDPKDGIVWIRDLEAARRFCNAGQAESGIDALRRLLARNSDNVPALLTLAGCNLALGRADPAVNACLLARDLAPEDSLVWFNLANARAMQGNGKAADEAYRKALAIQPRFADAYLNYAAFLMQAGKDAAALDRLRAARAEGVQDPDIEAELGVLLLKSGDVEGAMAGFRRALELNPYAEAPRRALEMLQNN